MRTHDVYLATSVEDIYIACSHFLQDILKNGLLRLYLCIA